MPRKTRVNYRKRRGAHLERAVGLRSRKRLRQQRAEIHAAMAMAKRMTIYPETVPGPWRAPDIKTNEGWIVESLSVDFATTAPSRDKARTMAREANAGDIEIQRMPVADQDGAMLSLGFERIGPNRVETPLGRELVAPIEDRYRKIS